MNKEDTKNGNGTEIPLEIDNQKANSPWASQTPAKKKKRRNKSDLGENFIAPDGGWGWLVAIASGISCLVTFTIMQQFGILFRDRFTQIGISSSEMTTIINTQQAVSACTGLFNGPLFRRFSYRQVAITGAILVFIGLLATVLANSFIFYLLSISVTYGIGRGFTTSASSLAVNTYFKVKRRTATAFQFAVAGLGPIVLPYVSTFLMFQYGVAGACLFYGGMSLHNIACGFIYQPVKWHVKKQVPDAGTLRKLSEVPMNDHQILDNAADVDTPMMARANDGCYGSKISLNSNPRRSSIGTVLSYKDADGNALSGMPPPAISPGTPKLSLSKPPMEPVKEIPHPTKETKFIEEEAQALAQKEERKKMSVFQKIAVFFDLYLLKDFTYFNLAVGMTLINFTEFNFAILTPFILNDFGFDSSEIAAAMSMLAACDMAVRFLIPFVMGRIKCENKVIFCGGVVGMVLGRSIVAYSRNFTVVLIGFGWIGLNKAMSVVFWNLIIPSYVPLNRLPAAAGLQLLLYGIFTLTCGPIVGLVRDATNYSVIIHWMNAICMMVVIAWMGQDMINKCRKKKIPEEDAKKDVEMTKIR